MNSLHVLLILSVTLLTRALRQCIPCITTTYRDNKISSTLIYHTDYDCGSPNVTLCYYQNTTYSLCPEVPKPLCYKPQANSVRARINIYVPKLDDNGDLVPGRLLASNRTIKTKESLSVCFDVCAAISKQTLLPAQRSCGNLWWQAKYAVEKKYLYDSNAYYYVSHRATSKGPDGFTLSLKPAPNFCRKNYCTPLCVTVSPLTFSASRVTVYGIGIDGRGVDPYGHIVVELIGSPPRPEERRIHTEFWQEAGKQIEIPPVTKNLFIDLAERIASELSVKNCYVCGGTSMGEQWPWEAKELRWQALAAANLTWRDKNRPSRWILQHTLVGKLCIIRQGPQYNYSVGALDCETAWVCNRTRYKQYVNFSATNVSLVSIPQVNTKTLLDVYYRLPCTDLFEWEAPDHLYWICGVSAYTVLPHNWGGACVLGTIRPSFFLLPISTGERLGVPVYDTLGRQRRSTRIDAWQGNEWPPERIIQVYGPATWAADGTYGYRTPIYMLNRIIRLQAVLEIITNETSLALNLLAVTNRQMRTAVYQNRLALDFLLAAEGGVCGKFNLTNCCLQIDDNGKAIEQITDRMRSLAHVPVQTWTGLLDTEGFLGSLFANWREILLMIGIALGGLMILPCLILIVRSMVRRSVEAAVGNIDAARILHVQNVRQRYQYMELSQMGDSHAYE